MKAIGVNFTMMLRQMKGDAMLTMLAVCPFIIGAFFKFLIPFAENLLTSYTHDDKFLLPYYTLFDAFLIMLTPSMFNYAAAMVMLEESDDHITSYLAVTPLGKGGYLLSRLGLTGLASFIVSVIVPLIFHLSQIGIFMFAGAALAGTVQGFIISLLITALSKNKVEGMAVGKFASLLSLGALVPYFSDGKEQFIASVLPSFWIGRAIRTGDYRSLTVSVLLSLLWIVILSNKFMKKIMG